MTDRHPRYLGFTSVPTAPTSITRFTFITTAGTSAVAGIVQAAEEFDRIERNGWALLELRVHVVGIYADGSRFSWGHVTLHPRRGRLVTTEELYAELDAVRDGANAR